MYKILVIAGEPSGDSLGSKLIKEIDYLLFNTYYKSSPRTNINIELPLHLIRIRQWLIIF